MEGNQPPPPTQLNCVLCRRVVCRGAVAAAAAAGRSQKSAELSVSFCLSDLKGGRARRLGTRVKYRHPPLPSLRPPSCSVAVHNNWPATSEETFRNKFFTQ